MAVFRRIGETETPRCRHILDLLMLSLVLVLVFVVVAVVVVVVVVVVHLFRVFPGP